MSKIVLGEEEKDGTLQKHIRAPSIWGRVLCGLRFEDLQDTRFEDTVKLLRKHYIPEEVTFKSLKLIEDRVGTDEFIHHMRMCMKDRKSIAVINEGLNELVGVIIMKLHQKYENVKITYNAIFTTAMNFYNKLEEPVNLFDNLGVESYLKINVVALKARYRHRGITKEMLKSAINLATSAKVLAIVGIFTTARLQQIAEELGFAKYNELCYIRYLVNDQVVFRDTGLGNKSAALMGYRIPGVEELHEINPNFC